jgi:hypothetical protein
MASGIKPHSSAILGITLFMKAAIAANNSVLLYFQALMKIG